MRVSVLRGVFAGHSSSIVAVALSGLALAGCGEDKDPLDGLTAGPTGGPSGGPGGGPGGGPTSNPSGNPTGDPTEGGTGTMTEGTTETGSSGHGDCDQYLACLAAVSPSSVPEAEMTIGPDGSCWTTPELTETCLEQCTQGLVSFGEAFPDEPACGGGGTSTTGPTSGPTSTTDQETTTFPETTGDHGNCGWDATNKYYACNYLGVDPDGISPIDCPAVLPQEGDPCDEFTPVNNIGCCTPGGINYYCSARGTIVIEQC